MGLTSTEEQQGGGLGAQPGPPALRRLISCSPEEFGDRYWGREALLSRAADLPQPFGDLLDETVVDSLVSERGLRTPFLRVARDGTTLADKAFTAPGGVGASIGDQVSDDKLVGLFAGGATMVLQALHRVWPPIIDFCQQLAEDLGHPVQANAYVTPPQNQGFSNHYDVHDVFVLQVAGEKEWTIHTPVHPAPLRDQPWTDRRAAVEQRATEAPVISATLHPGDCLYLPRGFLHAARARGGVSSHLTLGVHTWTRYALAERLLQATLAAAATEESVRSSLPLGVSFTDPTALAADLEAVRGALQAALATLDAGQLSAGLLRAWRDTQRAAPVGPLRQLRAAETLTGDATVQLRPHLAATVHRPAGQPPLVRSRAGELTLSETELPGVEALLAQGSLDAEKLGLDLARRMILAGLAVTA